MVLTGLDQELYADFAALSRYDGTSNAVALTDDIRHWPTASALVVGVLVVVEIADVCALGPEMIIKMQLFPCVKGVLSGQARP